MAQHPEGDLDAFLAKYGLSNCLKHLVAIKVSSLDALRKMPTNDLKAVGFRPEIRTKLQRALKGEEPEIGSGGQQEAIVTVDEEEEAFDDVSEGKKKGAKKKKPVKSAAAKAVSAAPVSVPGQEGVSLDADFAELLTQMGLSQFATVFERNNITSFISCRYVTREALVGTFGIPQDKAGMLLTQIVQRIPSTHDRRLPELANDLTAAVASMHVTENVREQVKTALQTNAVLTVADAKTKRYALMNEVGLSADAATELGRLLDAGPSVWQHVPAGQTLNSAVVAAGAAASRGGAGSPAQSARSAGGGGGVAAAAAASEWPAVGGGVQQNGLGGGGTHSAAPMWGGAGGRGYSGGLVQQVVAAGRSV